MRQDQETEAMQFEKDSWSINTDTQDRRAVEAIFTYHYDGLDL